MAGTLLPCAQALLARQHARFIRTGLHALECRRECALPTVRPYYLDQARDAARDAASVALCVLAHGLVELSAELTAKAVALDIALAEAAWPHPMTEAA